MYLKRRKNIGCYVMLVSASELAYQEALVLVRCVSFDHQYLRQLKRKSIVYYHLDQKTVVLQKYNTVLSTSLPYIT